MMEIDEARQERAASMAAWVVRLACREQKIDLRASGTEILAALDEVAPEVRWSVEFRADPTAFIAAHEKECSSLGEALEAADEMALHNRVEEALRFADAVQQQSEADIVMAVGASVAMIILAIRLGVIEIGSKGLTIRAYKSDRAVSDTVKAAAELVSSLFGGMVGKHRHKAPDADAPPEAQK